jgi:hypothetical protein
MKTAPRLALALALTLPAPILLSDSAATLCWAGPAVPDAPPADETANFAGTWYYVDPGYQIALFISQENPDRLSIHYHVQAKEGGEYETDAQGKARYLDSGDLVEVVFVGRRTATNRIEGQHSRTKTLKKGKVEESGDFEMWVGENGRKLVLHYPEWKVVKIDASGRSLISSKTDMYRLFRKASDIVVDFSEIKF